MVNEMKATPVAKRGQIEVYAGKVVGVYDGKGNAQGKQKSLCLNVRYYDEKMGKNEYENIFIPFWANEKFNAMELLEKMKLQKGQYVIVSAFRDKNNNLSGNRVVKGSGMIRIPKSGDIQYDTNVLMGSVVNVRKNDERGVCNVTMLINGKVADDKYDTINAEIAFWNSENKNSADNAGKALSKEDNYPRIIAVTGEQGEVTSFTRKNGETGYGTTFKGNSYFQFVPKKNDNENETSNDAEPNDDFMNIPDGLEEGVPFGNDLPDFMQ